MRDDNITLANWFTAKVKINVLSLENSFDDHQNTLNVDSFKAVKQLILTGFFTKKIVEKRLFRSFESLEILTIRGDYHLNIEMGVLDVLNTTLKEFTLKGRENTAFRGIMIDSFTGSGQLSKLEKVNIEYPLVDLTRKSFVGLTNVQYLDLSSCKIEIIGEGTFGPISKSLKTLNLQENRLQSIPAGLFDSMQLKTLNLFNNRLKSIPEGLFNSIVQNNVENIYIARNAWICNCYLLPLKQYYLQYPNSFTEEISCTDPNDSVSYLLYSADLCKTLPSSVTQTNPTEVSVLKTEFHNDQILLDCPIAGTISSSNYVTVKSVGHNMTIRETLNGSVIVYVDTQKENSTLIWFLSENQNNTLRGSKDINCLIGRGTGIVVNNLKENSAYIFCIMDAMEEMISPLNCMSYTMQVKRSSLQIWLLESSNTLIVGSLIIICSLSIFIGLAIGTFVRRNKYHPTINGDNRITLSDKAGVAALLKSFNFDTYGGM